MDQENAKLSLEIESLALDIKQKKIQPKLEMFKYAITSVATIVVFFLITRPDTLLNRRMSEDSIARERAKLMIDVLKEKDPELRKQGLIIIKSSYPSDNQWIKSVERSLDLQADYQIKQNINSEYEELEKRKREYQQQRSAYSPNSNDYNIITTKIGFINKQISNLKSRMEQSGNQ